MVNIAIIGYGGMGGYHAERLKSVNGIKVIGVYDIDKKRNAVAKENGLRVYLSKDEVAADKNINAVLIATPNDVHLPYVEFFAKNKKHILCEKPAACSSADFDKMVEASENSGVIFTVHQNRRLDADYLTVFDVIQSNRLGKIYRMDSIVSGANGIPGGWRKLKKHGGGMMLDWGVHLIDQFYHSGFTSPEKIYCKYSYVLGFKVDDAFDLSMDFKAQENQRALFADNVSVNIRVDTNSFVKYPRWMVYGEDGTLCLDDFSSGGHAVFKVETKEDVIAEWQGNGLTKTMAKRPKSGIETVKIENIKSDFNKLYLNFIDAIEKNEPLFVKPHEVKRVIEIMECAAKSAKKSQVIKFNK